jgi:hypothetical protein
MTIGNDTLVDLLAVDFGTPDESTGSAGVSARIR